jgi:alkanesulfonate monooxygenase SsuD/methylene tetrahydromethanopterin reductase-like flavin-dependent oxidoreductase (luciferase family)
LEPAVTRDIGLVLGSAIGPAHLEAVVKRTEELGFDEIWLAEDFFFTGGISAAAVCLARTENIRVGLGVVSAMARHPALLAMELATLAGVFPGRLVAGVGLGVPAWIEQMGLTPDSALSAVRECVESVKSLLAGEQLDFEGDTFSFRDVTLTYPIGAGGLPVHLGAIGPKMLELSGRIADGSVLSVLSSLDYLRWALDNVEAGRRAGGRSDHHRVTTFALYSVDHNSDRARDSMRRPLAFYLSAGGPNALTDRAGISEELRSLMDQKAPLEEVMPVDWVDRLTIAGDPEQVIAKISTYFDHGVDSMALFPASVEALDGIVEMTAAEVLPGLRDDQ